MEIAALALAAYVVGAIPFGLLIARACGVDIMKVGSGNIGATNVARTLGKGPGALACMLDVLKGAVPAALASYWFRSPEVALLCGAAAMMGHTASPFLKFRGGKGVATGFGMLLGSAPLVAAGVVAVFVLSMIICRIVSVSSIAAAASLVVFGLAFRQPTIVVGAYGLLAAYIVWRHRANIRRLREGTEPKFAFGGKDKVEGGP